MKRLLRIRSFAPIGILECWNNGIMGLEYCNVGLMAIIVAYNEGRAIFDRNVFLKKL